MKYIFFLPEIHQLQTGGNIYNRQMITQLEKSDGVFSVMVNSQFQSGNWSGDIKKLLKDSGNVFIIDSLLVRNANFYRVLDDINRSAKRYLMVHYLYLLDSRNHNTLEISQENKYLKFYDGFITTSNYSREKLIINGISEKDVVTIRPGSNQKRSSQVTHCFQCSARQGINGVSGSPGNAYRYRLVLGTGW
jgi:hypothetical protein